MDLEALNDRQRRALENLIRVLKAGDQESAKVILEAEFDEELREKVVEYLEDLGFRLNFVKKKKKVERVSAVPRNPVVVELPKYNKRITFNLRSPPPVERVKPLTKEYDLALIPVASSVYALLQEAKYEVLMMSHKIHPKITKVLRELSLQGLEVKVLVSESSCEEMRELGKLKKSCKLKAIGRLALKVSVPAVLSIMYSAPFDLMTFLLGALAGTSTLGLWGTTIASLVLNSPKYLYAGLPWALRGATLSSTILGMSALVPKRSRTEVRVLDRVPYSIVIIDRKKAIASQVPFSWKGDALSRVYRSSAEEPLKEFHAFWKAASSV